MEDQAKPGVGAATLDDEGNARFPGDAPMGEKPEGAASAGRPAGAAGGGSPEPDSDEASVEKLRGIMVKKGFKDVGALVDFASELERKNTLLSQDVQRLSAVTIPQPGMGYGPPARVDSGVGASREEELEIPENPVELLANKQTFGKFVSKVADQASARAEGAAVAARQRAEMEDQVRQVQELQREDPDGFRKLRGVMIDIANQNPNMRALRDIYKLAQDQVARDRKALVDEVRREAGLDGVDAERLKGIVSRVRSAPVSAGSGVQADPLGGAGKANQELLRAIADSDKF